MEKLRGGIVSAPDAGKAGRRSGVQNLTTPVPRDGQARTAILS
jgi:hypothetical protein